MKTTNAHFEFGIGVMGMGGSLQQAVAYQQMLSYQFDNDQILLVEIATAGCSLRHLLPESISRNSGWLSSTGVPLDDEKIPDKIDQNKKKISTNIFQSVEQAISFPEVGSEYDVS